MAKRTIHLSAMVIWSEMHMVKSTSWHFLQQCKQSNQGSHDSLMTHDTLTIIVPLLEFPITVLPWSTPHKPVVQMPIEGLCGESQWTPQAWAKSTTQRNKRSRVERHQEVSRRMGIQLSKCFSERIKLGNPHLRENEALYRCHCFCAMLQHDIQYAMIYHTGNNHESWIMKENSRFILAVHSKLLEPIKPFIVQSLK